MGGADKKKKKEKEKGKKGTKEKRAEKEKKVDKERKADKLKQREKKKKSKKGKHSKDSSDDDGGEIAPSVLARAYEIFKKKKNKKKKEKEKSPEVSSEESSEQDSSESSESSEEESSSTDSDESESASDNDQKVCVERAKPEKVRKKKADKKSSSGSAKRKKDKSPPSPTESSSSSEDNEDKNELSDAKKGFKRKSDENSSSIPAKRKKEDSREAEPKGSNRIRKKDKETVSEGKETSVANAMSDQLQQIMDMMKTQNEKIQAMEEKQAKAETVKVPLSSPGTPVTPLSEDPFLTPSGRRSTKASLTSTPISGDDMNSSVVSDVSLLDQSDTSLTPDMKQLNCGKKRGRPRKTLLPPTFDDFPEDGTEEEKFKWKKAKISQQWRYNKKVGPEAAEYRQKENERVKANYAKRSGSQVSEVSGSTSIKEELQVLDDLVDKRRAQSRQR